MTRSNDDPRIEYGTYDASDEASMVRLLGQVFCRHDPPAFAVGLEPAEFEAFVRLLCPGAAEAGLTPVARLADTGELVGALLTEDGAAEPPHGMDRLSAKFEPIFDLLGQLDAEYRSGRAVRPGESLHLFLLGVAGKVGGRGVAQQLVARCLSHGGSRGYRLAFTEATNRVSQHVFRKQGFVERVRRSYGSYTLRGEEMFASIAEHGGAVLMERTLP